MPWASKGSRLLLVSLLVVAADAERPNEGGETLALDALGHLSRSQGSGSALRAMSRHNATNGKDTALFQMKAALEDAAGKEAELRAALYHAVESEAALEQRTLDASTFPRRLLNPRLPPSRSEIQLDETSESVSRYYLGKGILWKKTDDGSAGPDAGSAGSDAGSDPDELPPNYCAQGPVRDDGCESLCYRLFLTKDMYGTCEEVKMDLKGLGWSEPGVKRMRRATTGKSRWYNWRRPMDGVWARIILNIKNEDVPGYMAGLLEYFEKGLHPGEEKKYASVIATISLGIDVRRAVDAGMRAIEYNSGQKRALEKLTFMINQASNSPYKYDTMGEGISTMKIINDQLRAKTSMEAALTKAREVMARSDEAADKAYLALSDALKQEGNLNDKDKEQRNLAVQCHLQLKANRKNLAQTFGKLSDTALKKLATDDGLEDGFKEVMELQKRMEKLSPACDQVLEANREAADNAKTKLRDKYTQAVADARKLLVQESGSDVLKKAREDLKPKIKVMKSLGMFEEVCAEAEEISAQLNAWDLLSTANSQAEDMFGEDEEGNEKEPSQPSRARLGKKLGVALHAAKCLPEEFAEFVDKAQETCESEKMVEVGGCPEPAPPPGPAPAEAPPVEAGAWHLAIPAFLAHALPVLVATLWPSS